MRCTGRAELSGFGYAGYVKRNGASPLTTKCAVFINLSNIGQEPPRGRHIWAILRIFDRAEYRDDFLAGRIRFNTLGRYRGLEGLGDDARGDRWEGISAFLQSDGMKLSFDGHEVGGLVGPIVHHPPGVDGWNVCSFVALQWPRDEPFNALDAPEVLEQIQLGPDLRKFGEYVALLADGEAFLGAVRRAAEERGLPIRARLVEYFDGQEMSGSVPHSLFGFVKRAVPYGCQREFRIVVPRDNPGEEVLWLDVSSGAPWGYATTIDEFNAQVRLRER